MSHIQIKNNTKAVRVFPDGTALQPGEAGQVPEDAAKHPVVTAWADAGDISIAAAPSAVAGKGKGRASKSETKTAEIAALQAAVTAAQADHDAAHSAIDDAPEGTDDAELDALAAREAETLSALHAARAALDAAQAG